MKDRGISMYTVAKATGVNVITLYGWAKGNHRPRYWSDSMQRVIQWCCMEMGVVLTPYDFILDVR